MGYYDPKQLWVKIIINSCYQPVLNHKFKFYNEDVNNKVTEVGKAILLLVHKV